MIVEIFQIFQDELLNPHLGGITLEKHENNGQQHSLSVQHPQLMQL